MADGYVESVPYEFASLNLPVDLRLDAGQPSQTASSRTERTMSTLQKRRGLG